MGDSVWRKINTAMGLRVIGVDMAIGRDRMVYVCPDGAEVTKAEFDRLFGQTCRHMITDDTGTNMREPQSNPRWPFVIAFDRDIFFKGYSGNYDDKKPELTQDLNEARRFPNWKSVVATRDILSRELGRKVHAMLAPVTVFKV